MLDKNENSELSSSYKSSSIRESLDSKSYKQAPNILEIQ